MNIGILVSGFPPEVIAGAELQAQQTAEQLARQGHRVTVFTRSSGFYSSRVKQDGYTVNPRRVLPVTGVRMIWDIVSALWDIAHCRPRPEVVLCYEYVISGLIGVVAQRLLGIPAAVSIRGNREYRLHLHMRIGLLAPFVFKRAKRIIVQTPGMFEDLQRQLQIAGKTELSRIVRAKTRVIPNGIHLPPPERAEGSKVIYIGRLVPRKGVADLITAMKQVPQAELLVVGDGSDRTRLEVLAEGSPIAFVGRVPHDAMANYLRQARVLVLPSYLGDGLPNVIMEAMSYGVPVVATNTAGIPDIVSHGETGYLYEPGDIRQMIIYISRLLADDELHRKFGEQSLQAVQSYSWDIVAPQIEQLLSECIR
jgi:glycosyltransferase involved in cell wall biosynthesis